MSVFVDEKNSVFYLENEKVSYVFGINAIGMPEHIYFGAPVGHDLKTGETSAAGRNHPITRIAPNGKKVRVDNVPSEYPVFLNGDFGETALLAERENGNRRFDLAFAGYEILSKKIMPEGIPALREGEGVRIDLCDKELLVSLYYYLLPGCSVLTRSAVIKNRGEAPVRLSRAYSFAFSLPDTKAEAVYLTGASGSETNVRKTPLFRGIFRLDSKRGRSSATVNPFLAIAKDRARENAGEVWGINLVTSGSWCLQAEGMPNASLRVLGGIQDEDFEWLLEPGEEFQTPEAVLCYSGEGLSGMSREFHRAYREALIPRRFVNEPRCIVINNWEGTRFNFTAEKLRAIAERVKGTGIDTFVLDDGWFGIRDTDTTGLGDWVVNEEKLGCTLDEFIENCHALGFRFGLWFEPEMVSRNSDLFRAHPDWAMQTPDDEAVECRQQLMLDLANPAVRENIAEQVNTILHNHKIDYVKWDCNRDLTEGYSLYLPKERQKESFYRNTLGFYDLCHRIIEANPTIFFEGCASGGSRMDPGMLFYFPQVWASDQTDAPMRCRIQYGASLCYPLSSHSCHVTESPNRRAAHITPIETRAAVASLGATGYEWDTTKMTDEEVAAIPGQIAEYRAWEDLVLEGDLCRLLSPFETNFFAEELISADRARAKIVVVKMQEFFNMPEERLYPEKLEEDAPYLLAETGEVRLGKSWMRRGILPAWPQGDFCAQTFHFLRQE